MLTIAERERTVERLARLERPSLHEMIALIDDPYRRAQVRELILRGAQLLGEPELLPVLAGGSPAIPPSTSTGGSAGPSQIGGAAGARGPLVNVPTGAPILSPLPNGFDDTEALQSWLNSCVGGRGVWQSSPTRYIVKAPLFMPSQSYIECLNPETCEVERVGNGDTFRIGGSCTFFPPFVRASAAQASGAVFNFELGEPNSCWIFRPHIGDNVAVGINAVGVEALGNLGNIHIVEPSFNDLGHRCKGVKTMVKVGSSTVRSIGIWIVNPLLNVNAAAEGTIGFDIVNTDTLHMIEGLVQNAAIAYRWGEGDTSVLKSTNSFIVGAQADGCTLGHSLQNLQERHSWVGVTAEAGGTGASILNNVSGVKMAVPSFSHNAGDGLLGQTATPNGANTIVGGDFNDNGENAEANRAGIHFAGEGDFGWLLNGNNVGNFATGGGGLQKLGLFTAPNVKLPLPRGNRIAKNASAQLSLGAGTTPTVAEIEAANSMT